MATPTEISKALFDGGFDRSIGREESGEAAPEFEMLSDEEWRHQYLGDPIVRDAPAPKRARPPKPDLLPRRGNAS